jgi:hypothetical protein
MESELVSFHELRAIEAVRLNVDGLSGLIEGTDVSEVTLAAQLTSQLTKAGLKVVTELGSQAPTLHVRVLPIQGQDQRFFVITAELEEACKVPRSGGIDVPFCTTWSIYPRLGFFAAGDVSVLVGQFAGVGQEFVNAWTFDNPRSKK